MSIIELEKFLAGGRGTATPYQSASEMCDANPEHSVAALGMDPSGGGAQRGIRKF